MTYYFINFPLTTSKDFLAEFTYSAAFPYIVTYVKLSFHVVLWETTLFVQILAKTL